MSALGDAMSAIRNVILMQERVLNMQKSLDQLLANVDGLSDYAVAIDKRVVRLETMVEVASRSANTRPQIEKGE